MHTDIDRWRVVVYIVSGFVVGLRQLSQWCAFNPLNVVTIYIYGHIKLPVIAATIYICS